VDTEFVFQDPGEAFTPQVALACSIRETVKVERPSALGHDSPIRCLAGAALIADHAVEADFCREQSQTPGRIYFQPVHLRSGAFTP
jgi:hypothetical protein